MKLKHTLIIILIAVVTGCSSQVEPTPTVEEPISQATTAPTNEPNQEPTSDPPSPLPPTEADSVDTGDSLPLDEVFSTEDIQIAHPSGWEGRQAPSSLISVTNNPALFTGDTTMDPGQAAVSLWQPRYILARMRMAPSASAEALICRILNQEFCEDAEAGLEQFADEYTFEELTVKGERALAAYPSDDAATRYLLAAQVSPNNAFILELSTAPGELEQFLPTFLAMAETVDFAD